MNARLAARLGWSIFGLAVLTYVVALALNLRRPQSPTLSETTGDLMAALTFLPYGWLGDLYLGPAPSDQAARPAPAPRP